MENVYEANYKVRISDANRRGYLKMPALLQMLQEIATEHAQKMGVAYDNLKPLNLGWALSKICVEICRIPKWGERLYMSTWPSSRDRIATYREFTAKDASLNTLFTARSQWLLFDTTQRRLARMNRLPEWPMNPEVANGESFSETFEKVEISSAEAVESKFEARNDDIDLNGHVNNSVFLIWAVESVPAEFSAEREPMKIRVSFLEEVLPQSEIRALCMRRGETTSTSLYSAASGRECARVRIDWRACPQITLIS